MIELIYNEEGESTTEERALQEPKNVKQVGEPKDYKKIFIEDYVHTFLMQYSAEKESKVKTAILLGKNERSGGKRHLYIKGALPVEHVYEKQGKYCFTEKMWGDIYRECEKYFPEQEILGWFLAKPGFPVEKTAVLEETHRTYFSGADKVLFVVEPLERDSGFFGFDGNRFARQSGYYIYYERNNAMQTYMIDHQDKNEREETLRQEEEKLNVATRQFRNIVQEKQEEIHKRKMTSFMYTVSSVLVMIVLIIGITMMNNYDKMNDMEKSLAILTKNSIQKEMERETEKEVNQETEQAVEVSTGETVTVAVETVSGNVDKLSKEEEESQVQSQTKEEGTENTPEEKKQEEENQEENSEQSSQEVSENQEPVQKEEKKEEDADSQKTQAPQENETVTQSQEEEAQETTAEPNYYVIQEGDTLAEISIRVYHTKKMVSRICEVNGIENVDKIFVGQKILLP